MQTENIEIIVRFGKNVLGEKITLESKTEIIRSCLAGMIIQISTQLQTRIKHFGFLCLSFEND